LIKSIDVYASFTALDDTGRREVYTIADEKSRRVEAKDEIPDSYE
jgi:hypothetical protein